MTDRITIRQLEGLCEAINRRLELPLTPYTRKADGTFTPNAGAYHLAGQYGGYALHQMSETPGCTGIHEVIGTTTKRDLYNRMRAYLDGMHAGTTQ